MRLAHALDQQQDEQQMLLARIGSAIGKYWICKRAAQHTYECMESIGAVGLIEDNVLARLYREAPVNAIWEGSGNIQCLDVLRAMQKESGSIEAFIDEIEQVKGSDKGLDKRVEQIRVQLNDPSQWEFTARSLVESLALCWQGATLLRWGNDDVATAFLQSRIHRHGGYQYGTLPSGIDCAAIILRAQPTLELD